MNKKKCYYINTYSTDSHHEMANASFLLIVQHLHNDVIFYGTASNINAIGILLKPDGPYKGILTRKVVGIRGHSKISHFFKYMVSAFQDIALVLSAPKGSSLFFSFCNLFSLRIINILNKWRAHSICFVCHGELEFLQENLRIANISMKVQAAFAKKFFQFSKVPIHSKIKFIVLGDSILDNLRPLLSASAISHFLAVDHPYIFSKSDKNVIGSMDINLGTVGTLNIYKGSENYVKLLTENKFPPNIKFYAIGSASDNYQNFKDLGVSLNPENVFLSRDKLEETIKTLNYVLFFYPSDRYRLTASGAIFDAINYNKQIIALENDYFKYLFKKFGSIGYIVSDLNEMANVIRNLEPDLSMNLNFEKIKSETGTEYIANKLKLALNGGEE